jgi:hypothetical protein
VLRRREAYSPESMEHGKVFFAGAMLLPYPSNPMWDGFVVWACEDETCSRHGLETELIG